MSFDTQIFNPLIDNLNLRLIEDNRGEFIFSEDENKNKKKILKLILISCTNNSKELFSSLINLIDGKMSANSLANFIDFCIQNQEAQEYAFELTKHDSFLTEQRYKYLTKLYEATINDIEETAKVHNPANNLEEIEFNKAKKTDKIERTFQQMVNDMIYLVDYLNRNTQKKTPPK